MKLSEITNVPFLLLDDPDNPYVTEEIMMDWGYEDEGLMPVFEICKWGYILGTLKPNVTCCFCGNCNPYNISDVYAPYKCRVCLKRFNVFTNTIFSNKKMPFICYDLIYDDRYSWSEAVKDGCCTNATYYKLKKKFAFMDGLKFDNIFQKWQYLLNYKLTPTNKGDNSL